MARTFFGEELTIPTFSDVTKAAAISVVAWLLVIMPLRWLDIPLGRFGEACFLAAMFWGSICAAIIRRRTWQQMLLILAGLAPIWTVLALLK